MANERPALSTIDKWAGRPLCLYVIWVSEDDRGGNKYQHHLKCDTQTVAGQSEINWHCILTTTTQMHKFLESKLDLLNSMIIKLIVFAYCILTTTELHRFPGILKIDILTLMIVDMKWIVDGEHKLVDSLRS